MVGSISQASSQTLPEHGSTTHLSPLQSSAASQSSSIKHSGHTRTSSKIHSKVPAAMSDLHVPSIKMEASIAHSSLQIAPSHGSGFGSQVLVSPLHTSVSSQSGSSKHCTQEPASQNGVPSGQLPSSRHVPSGMQIYYGSFFFFASGLSTQKKPAQHTHYGSPLALHSIPSLLHPERIELRKYYKYF